MPARAIGVVRIGFISDQLFLVSSERLLDRNGLVVAGTVFAPGKRFGGILRLPKGHHSIAVGLIVIIRIRELANPILAMPVGDPDRPGAGAAAVPELYAAGDADPIRLAADSKAQPDCFVSRACCL